MTSSMIKASSRMSWIIAAGETPTQFTVDRIMDENDFLLDIINKKLTSGDFEEAVSYQKILQRNLTFLMELRSQRGNSK
ncbi:hypothetical protein ACTXT7_008969 [Hymenolepis weldensis]